MHGAIIGKDAALIIVEPQNDFTEGGALPAQNASEAIKIINKIIPKFRYGASFKTVPATGFPENWHF